MFLEHIVMALDEIVILNEIDQDGKMDEGVEGRGGYQIS